MCLVETKIEYESYVNYFDYHCYGERWTKGILKTADIIDLDTMTFTLKIDIIDIFDAKGNNLDPYTICQSMDNHVFENNYHDLVWNIDADDLNAMKNIKNEDMFQSKEYEIKVLDQKFEWYLKLWYKSEDDNKVNLKMGLKEMPDKVKDIWFGITIDISETGMHEENFGHHVDLRLYEGRKQYGNFYNIPLYLTGEELSSMNKLTIKGKLCLMSLCYH